MRIVGATAKREQRRQYVRTMIDGLKVTIPGEQLRRLLETQIQHHAQHAARWTHEQNWTTEDETEDAPLLPEHICRNESGTTRLDLHYGPEVIVVERT